MADKFTPGPWTFNGMTTIITADEQTWIAGVVNPDWRQVPDRPERDANAYLIAAAPDLLEALRRLTGLIRDCHNVFQNHSASWLMRQPAFAQAEAAIHKTGGQDDESAARRFSDRKAQHYSDQGMG